MRYVFNSLYGYNSLIRIGRIYYFSPTESLVYLLQVNRDLILLNNTFYKFFRHCKYYIKLKRLTKYFTPNHLRSIELGEKTIKQIKNEILNNT